MIYKTIIALLFFFLVSLFSNAAAQTDSVVSIRLLNGKDSLGSGVLVLNGQYVLTAYHVVNGNSRFEITHSNKVYQNGMVISYSEKRDLTLIDLGVVVGNPLSLSAKPIKVGETAYTLGYAKGLVPRLTKGILSESKPSNSIDGTFLVTTASAIKGDSGGVILNKKGEIVGMAQRGLNVAGTEYFSYRGRSRTALRYEKTGGHGLSIIKEFLDYTVEKLKLKETK